MVVQEQERGPLTSRRDSDVAAAAAAGGIVGVTGVVVGVLFHEAPEIALGAALVIALLGLLAWRTGVIDRASATSSVALLAGVGLGIVVGPAITGPVDTGDSFAPPMNDTVALALLGVACAIVALAGGWLLLARRARIGLGILAIGVLAFMVAANAPVAAGTNPAMSLPIVIGYGVGLLGIVVGYVGTVVSLLGLSRWAAVVLPIVLSAALAPWVPPLAALVLAAFRIGRSGR